MPYLSEHSARVLEPDLFIEDSFRRKNIEDGIDIIIGRLKEDSGNTTVQAYRFKKDKFTVEEAKKWLEEHNIKYIVFEPAVDNSSVVNTIETEDKAEIYLIGPIADEGTEDFITPKSFKEQLDKVKDKKEIHIYVNSEGGSVFSALAIYNMIKQIKNKTVAHVLGLAASAAGWMIASASKIIMPTNALLMLHLPKIYVFGNKKELYNSIAQLEQVEDIIASSFIRKNSKLTKEEIKRMINEKDEIWLTGEDAYKLSFVDELEPQICLVNCSNNIIVDGITYDKNKFSKINDILLKDKYKKYENKINKIKETINKWR